MASIYNDVVSSRRGSSALLRCHSRFVLCSSTDWIAALRMPRLPCWDHLGHICCAKGMSCRGRTQGRPGFHPSQLLHPVRGHQLGHIGTRGQSNRTGTRYTRKGAMGANQPPGAACEGREEHGCKALVQGKGRCKQRRRDLGTDRHWQGAWGKKPSGNLTKTGRSSTQQTQILV